MKTNGEEPINPCEVQIDDKGKVYQNMVSYGAYTASGLTKREYFAAMAMQGIMSMVATGSHSVPNGAEDVAKTAVQQADELIKALNEQ